MSLPSILTVYVVDARAVRVDRGERQVRGSCHRAWGEQRAAEPGRGRLVVVAEQNVSPREPRVHRHVEAGVRVIEARIRLAGRARRGHEQLRPARVRDRRDQRRWCRGSTPAETVHGVRRDVLERVDRARVTAGVPAGVVRRRGAVGDQVGRVGLVGRRGDVRVVVRGPDAPRALQQADAGDAAARDR